MKLLIVTTDEATMHWGTLADKLQEVENALNTTQGKTEDWEVEIIYRPLKPEINNGRISHAWFDEISYPLFKQGNHFIAIHMSEEQKKEWGIKRTLLGSNIRDKDFVGEMYLWADESTQSRKRPGLNQFVQTLLHECSHELANTTDTVEDKTHEYHDENKDIKGIFESYDISTWQPKYQLQQKSVSILMLLVKLLLQKLSLIKEKIYFFTDDFPVSQEYGVRNAAWYPITKHHIGTDYATPVGTPIIAPTECTVVRSETSSVIGNWCEVQIGDKYYCFMHLKSKTLKGLRKKGWVIGFTGNTGFTTAPHCHIEGWTEPRNLSIINEENYQDYTFNIEKL